MLPLPSARRRLGWHSPRARARHGRDAWRSHPADCHRPVRSWGRRLQETTRL